MRSALAATLALILSACIANAGELTVTGIKAAHRNGQTFVTWKDVAEGEAGVKYRYSLYRSGEAITQENLAAAELCYHGVFNNSCKQLGYAFRVKDRLDPKKPTLIIEEGGKPLAMWTGLAVRTALKPGRSFYAVMVTDEKYKPVGKIAPGKSATKEAVEEKVAPIQPIKIKTFKSAAISGTPNLPLRLALHGSSSRGGGVSAAGDNYVFFGTPDMGWRDGLPGIFAVYEQRGKCLITFMRDAIVHPGGNAVQETCWFGYFCIPQNAKHTEPRAYPFTENRLDWAVKWIMKKYRVDPLRVYSGGQSMGAMGSTQWAHRKSEVFAAVFPRLGRVRQSWLPCIAQGFPKSISSRRWKKPAPMPDGKTNYFTRMDSVKWVTEHHEDLPFYCFVAGRTDYVEPWKSQIEMIKALTASHHGFAFAWGPGGHSSSTASKAFKFLKNYNKEKFALNRSYPALGNSSIDHDMGNGDPKNGDMQGGINLGFNWTMAADEAGKWSVKLSNDLCKAVMTVNVTPRRCQKFKTKPGEKFKWTSSTDGKGDVTADKWGLVTIQKIKIEPGKETTLSIMR